MHATPVDDLPVSTPTAIPSLQAVPPVTAEIPALHAPTTAPAEESATHTTDEEH